MLFGVVEGTATEPRVTYLREPLPVNAQILSLADPVDPREVMRFATNCATSACQHFDGERCQLAAKIVGLLPSEGGPLPACGLRPRCRWWQEQGKDACMRCPIIVTQRYAPDPLLRLAANPATPQSQ